MKSKINRKIDPSLVVCVDGSCIGNPGRIEYRGVNMDTKEVLFQFGRNQSKEGNHIGTNNIAEFLAICHAVGYCKKITQNYTIYSDSKTAISWFSRKKCNTKFEPKGEVKKRIEKSEEYLKTLMMSDFQSVRKWDTKNWGEIPADYGRK